MKPILNVMYKSQAHFQYHDMSDMFFYLQFLEGGIARFSTAYSDEEALLWISSSTIGKYTVERQFTVIFYDGIIKLAATHFLEECKVIWFNVDEKGDQPQMALQEIFTTTDSWKVLEGWISK